MPWVLLTLGLIALRFDGLLHVVGVIDIVMAGLSVVVAAAIGGVKGAREAAKNAK